MRNTAITILFLGVLLGSASGNEPVEPAAADQPGASKLSVGRYGDLTTVQFLGNQLFTTEELQDALGRDMKVQMACRPSSRLGDLVTCIERRLTEGYAYSGCPDASVKVSIKETEHHLVVSVAEGSRYTAGEIEVRGSKPVDSDAIKQSLTESHSGTWPISGLTLMYRGQPPGNNDSSRARDETNDGELRGGKLDDEVAKTYWTSGEPVRYHRDQFLKMLPRVAESLARQGFPHARFSLEIEPREDGKIADLVITVRDVGPSPKIDAIHVSGLDRHTREELLEVMQIAEGLVINADMLKAAFQRLRDSCRFWRYEMVLDFPSSPEDEDATTQLYVHVVEYPHVPRLDRPLQEIDQVLLRAANWGESFPHQEEWDVVGSLKASDASPQAGTEATWLMSPKRGIIVDLEIQSQHPVTTSPLRGAFRLCVSKSRVLFADMNHQDMAAIDWKAVAPLKFEIASGEVNESEFTSAMKVDFGFSSVAKSRDNFVDIEVHPAALIDLVYNEGTRWDIKNDRLTIHTQQNEVLEFETTTGRYIRYESITPAGDCLKVATVPHDSDSWQERERATDHFSNGLEPTRPAASLLDYALELVSRLSTDTSVIPHSQRESLHDVFFSEPFQAVEGVGGALTYGKKAIPASSFQLPGSWPHHFRPGYSPAGMADYLFSRETWPWTLTREGVFGYANLYGLGSTPQDAQAEFQRIMARDDTGPIGYWIVGKFCELDRYSAREALGGFDDETLDREIAMLIAPEAGFTELLRNVVPLVQATSDREIDRLGEYIGNGWGASLKPWVALLRRLDSSNDDALRMSVSRLVKQDLRPIIEADLQRWASGISNRKQDSSDTKKKPPSPTSKPEEKPLFDGLEFPDPEAEK